MAPFNLEEFEKHPYRKIVTRDGRNVRIVCTDAPEHIPYMYGFIEGDNGITNWRKDGMWACKTSKNDLFFTDEEEGLTEFEKEVQFVLNHPHCTDMLAIKAWSKILLDLARKELEKENIIIDKDRYLKICDQYYNNGKKNALKDLPKWKKATEDKECDRHVLLFENKERILLTTEIYEGEYYIEADDLITLPKEE